ncbi:MAG: thiamine diphosphokinase [Candidatus Azobacteroides sp.]|nr:thiamine diphosphokinase [Candidatus Azobacteroides sp.]
MIPLLQNFKTVLLADGSFPEHAIPLSFLQKAERIICCDGAAENLLQYGLEPDYIVGDLDSLSDTLKKRFSPTLFHNPDQETNDLTKSVAFCSDRQWNEVTILGASGKREDHTLGNLSLLTDYAEKIKVQLLTDYGVFVPQLESTSYESYPGQQISIFSLTPATVLTTHRLLYPLEKRRLSSWWQGTLNEAEADFFTIEMTEGKLLVFRNY